MCVRVVFTCICMYRVICTHYRTSPCIVLISGHGDSWDIAEGAMDDGGGFMSSWEAVRVLHSQGVKPKRTIRAVVWVNEENGDKGN